MLLGKGIGHIKGFDHSRRTMFFGTVGERRRSSKFKLFAKYVGGQG